MQKLFKLLVSVFLLVSFVSLEACSTVRKISGRDKSPPDEFAVVNRPPLIMPPEYQLKPPEPGSTNPQDLAASVQTLRALFPENPGVAPQKSMGEAALLRSIEAQPLSDVRAELGDPDTEVVEKGTVLEDIIGIEEREGSPDGSSISRIGSEQADEGGGN